MSTNYTLENDLAKLKINALGAELTSFLLKEDSTEYLWQADPKFWGRHAPILFPIVGRLKDNTYKFEGKTYSMTQHGFARDLPFELVSNTNDSCVLKLVSNQETLAKYPFEFELLVSYSLEKTSLKVCYEVKNILDKTMYFSIGAHPGFNLPLTPGVETVDDYIVEFDRPETADLLLIDGGLISPDKKRFLTNEATFTLSSDLFKNDALIFSNLKSDTVSLRSLKTGKFVKMDMTGFPYLGIWSQSESAPFVCFEPWFGIADEVDSDYDFTAKLGMQRLEANQSFDCTYSITIG